MRNILALRDLFYKNQGSSLEFVLSLILRDRSRLASIAKTLFLIFTRHLKYIVFTKKKSFA